MITSSYMSVTGLDQAESRNRSQQNTCSAGSCYYDDDDDDGECSTCICCLFYVPDQPYFKPSADLKRFSNLQNLVTGLSSPILHENVLFLEEDAEELDDRLEDNSKFSEPFQRPVTAIKQEFIEHILKEQPYRRSHLAEISQNKRLLATVSFLDLTSLEYRYLYEEPYMFIRDEYKKMMDILSSEGQGEQGSVLFTGQNAIGKSRRFSLPLFLCADIDTQVVHRKEEYALLLPCRTLEGRKDYLLSDIRKLVSL
jgi:hypothetical protein